MKTAIVIPAYNEEKTIGVVIKNAKKYGTIFVINDASHDRTVEVARKAGAVVVTHEKNTGLGGALRTGFQKALEKDFDVVVTIDADGQHLASDIPKFLEKINEGYDFVLGRRDLRHYPFIKKFGNFFLNRMTNIVSGTNLKDTESGFRAFRADALKKFNLYASRYEIAAELIFESGRHKLKSTNVDIYSPVYRKGVGFWDGINNFRFIVGKKITA